MIILRSLSLGYGKENVIEKLDMHIRPGEKIALMGPSGCGKTSLLRSVAGIMKPSGGSISVNGSVSCIFQEPRLLPWLSAVDNVNAVLSDSPASLPKARQWLEAVGLSDSADKHPAELSGGMQQRLSIARALAYGGDILLADEPLKGMDSALRVEIARLMQKCIGDKTFVLVTHDEAEARSFAHRVFIYEDKKFIET